MMQAVFDSSVIIAGSGWRGESHLCLVAMARRRLRVFTSEWIVDEVRRALAKLQLRGELERDPLPVVNWFAEEAHWVSPWPTGKQRSRDPKDDPILGAALSAHASIIVSLNNDLLVLEKPLGIAVLRPRELLARLQRPI